LQIEENYARTQEKQLELFERDIKINWTQYEIVQAIVGLVEAMEVAFKRDTQNNVPITPTLGVQNMRIKHQMIKNNAHMLMDWSKLTLINFLLTQFCI
jgi:hypothetical protein